MVISTNNAFYLGSGGLPTVGSSLAPISLLPLTYDSGANNLVTPGTVGDTVTYDTGSGTVTEMLSSVHNVRVTVTHAGGTVTGNAVLIVTQSGQVFLEESSSSPNLLDNLTMVTDVTFLNIGGNTSNLIPNPEITGSNVVCFARGTLIRTPSGETPVEDLRQGDEVVTADHGCQPIRWIGSVYLPPEQLDAQDHLRPIRIRAGALGGDTPERDLIVSPQHRILVRSKIARRMFGTDEILVAAKHLAMIRGIQVLQAGDGVEYFRLHFLCDRHEVVFANGAASESLFTGPQALAAVSPEAREEILALFPKLAEIDYRARACRDLPGGRQSRRLALRHRKNRTPLTGTTLRH